MYPPPCRCSTIGRPRRRAGARGACPRIRPARSRRRLGRGGHARGEALYPSRSPTHSRERSSTVSAPRQSSMPAPPPRVPSAPSPPPAPALGRPDHIVAVEPPEGRDADGSICRATKPPIARVHLHRVGLVEHGEVRPRRDQHPGGACLAACREFGECGRARRQVRRALQAGRECDGILERHRAAWPALGGVGCAASPISTIRRCPKRGAGRGSRSG